MIGLIFDNKDEVEKAILENVKNVSLNASKRVDREFQLEFKGVLKKFADIYWILNFITNYSDKEINDIKFDSKMLLWQGANSMLGAIHLIRMGYFVEPNFLERHAIENLSITLALFRNYRRYNDFKSGKLSGEKCIGEAKKVIAQIGSIYGVLCDITHPSKKWLGTYVADERKTLLIGGGIVDEHLYRVKLNFAILGFLSSVYLSGVELVYFDYIEDPKFWKRQDSDKFQWNPSEEEKRYGAETAKAMSEVIKSFS